ncbi:MAG: cupin domain-containing protein [Ferruginibacter sp.]|nr:cupin domain-containing protein [Ferruginibacter sp.]
MEKLNKLSRKEVIQNLGLTTLGFGLLNLASCNNQPASSDKTTQQNLLLPFYIPPIAPLDPGIVGMNVRTIIRSSQTNKQFSSVEMAIAPKHMGPPPHLHKDLDEIMFVLEGTATVMVDGKIEEVQTGGWHLRPRKLEHTYWNATNKPLRFIDMYFNQNFEDFLEELYIKIFPEMIKNNLTPNDPKIGKRLAELDKKFGITTFAEKRKPLADKYGLIA